MRVDLVGGAIIVCHCGVGFGVVGVMRGQEWSHRDRRYQTYLDQGLMNGTDMI